MGIRESECGVRGGKGSGKALAGVGPVGRFEGTGGTAGEVSPTDTSRKETEGVGMRLPGCTHMWRVSGRAGDDNAHEATSTIPEPPPGTRMCLDAL